MNRSAVLLLTTFLFALACATSPATEQSPRHLTGSGGDVQVDADIASQNRAGEPITVRYTVTNERPAPINIAEVVAETAYDAQTNMATLKVGKAAAGTTPTMVRIAPGQKKSFTATARFTSPALAEGQEPPLLRLQVNFVDDGRHEAVYTNAIPAYR